MRLIDADAIFKNGLVAVYEKDAMKTVNKIIKSIQDAPTVDAVPVVRGEWKQVTHSRGGHECSICNSYAPSYASGNEHISNFCPNCGADMRKKVE